MATSASAPQYSANSAYPSADYYAAYAQGYHQAPAYHQPAWPPQQPTYAGQAYATPAEESNPPVPGTEQPAVEGAASAAADPQAQPQYAQDAASYYQQHHDYYQYQQQYYQHYGHYHHYPQHSAYAQPAQYTASAPAWPAPASSQQPVVLPVPVQQAQPAGAPQPAVQAVHPASSSAQPAQRAGYMLMPDGRYKPMPREKEAAKPEVIKFQLPKKAKSAATAQPAYTKVADVKAPEKAPEAKQSSQFPQSLNSWVQRCFGSDIYKKDPQKVQDAIKVIIKDASDKGETWSRNWDKAPIPGSAEELAAPAAARPSVRPNRWDEGKPAAQKQMPTVRPASPSASLTSRSSRSSYSSGSRSRSRSSSRSFTSRSRSRSVSSSRSPTSSLRSGRSGRGRKRPNGSLKGSPFDFKGRAKKLKQAGPPETKKQRKKRLAAENQASKQAMLTGKKGKEQGLLQKDDKPTPEELARRRARAGRFGSGAVDHSIVQVPSYAAELIRERQPNAVDSSEGSWDQHAVQGTCKSLEKKYFRLTGPPDPSLVRPPHILKAALERVVKMYRAGQCDMHYAEDQLKAMRQDVTVQHVKGQLPVQIYEAHARACLEHGNGGDFNQCQTVLKVLYEGGSQGSVQEFVAYRVLYQSILRSKESASLLATLEHLSPQDVSHPAVAHALKVRQALVFSNYTAFFQLYASAPNLGRALMDMCFSRTRFAALETLVDAFKNTKVKIVYVATVLGFLVKHQGESNPINGEQAVKQGSKQKKVRPRTPTVEMSNVHLRFDGQGNGKAAGELALPGCARTTHQGKHPAEMDEASACGAAVKWLRSCNASVLLDPGGVHDALFLVLHCAMALK